MHNEYDTDTLHYVTEKSNSNVFWQLHTYKWIGDMAVISDVFCSQGKRFLAVERQHLWEWNRMILTANLHITASTETHTHKAIVDSRLRPQWCFHVANVTEMEEMLDCKLDALIRSYAWEKKRFSCQHKSTRISTPWMHADLESIVRKFAGDPAICLGELMVGANSVHCLHCGQTNCNTPRRRYRGRAK